VLDMNADDLSKDLSVDFHTRTANNMDKIRRIFLEKTVKNRSCRVDESTL